MTDPGSDPAVDRADHPPAVSPGGNQSSTGTARRRRRLGPGAPAVNNAVTLACTVVGTLIAVLTFVHTVRTNGREGNNAPPPVAATRADAVLGVITGDLSRRPSEAGESSLGDVIADAQLYYTRNAGAQIALVNPGGIRESLLYAATSHGEASGQVTVAECLAVQPFRERPLVTMTLTGSEIRQALEQQFAGHLRQTETQILQVSEGLGYRIDPAAPPGGRITQLVLDNDPLDPSADYRVTVNAFLADGGDGFGVFQAGRQRKGARGADYDALAAYLLRGEPVAPGPQDRVGLDDGT